MSQSVLNLRPLHRVAIKSTARVELENFIIQIFNNLKGRTKVNIIEMRRAIKKGFAERYGHG